MTEPSPTGYGEEIARMRDEVLDPDRDLSVARDRFLAERPRRKRMTARPVALATVVAAAAAIAAGVVALWPQPPLTFQVEGADAPTAVGAPITADGPEDAVLRFSDGSTVAIRPHTRVRTTSLGVDGATILLEQGSGQVSVVPGPSKRWYFDAGEFRINVTGTRFDMGWQPEAHTLVVHLDEGSIEVTGCSMSSGIDVVPGQTLQVRCVDNQTEAVWKSVAAMPPTSDAELENAGATPSESAGAPATSACPSSSSASIAAELLPSAPSSVPSDPRPKGRPEPAASDQEAKGGSANDPATAWRALAASGRYREAYDASVAAGFETLCDTSPAEDLIVLAETALYAGHAEHAKRAMLATRRRFAGTVSAATAAFMLGRIAFDQEHHYVHAGRWFRLYLSERPSGHLARDARGRLIETEHRSKNSGAAREMAREYLQRYPDGPHAPLARSLVAD